LPASLEPVAPKARVDRSAEDVRWWPVVTVDGVCYQRATVRTPWIRPGDDLGAALADGLAPLLRNGDLAIVSEKVVVISAGLGVPVADVTVGPLARRLASWVRPTAGSRGLSIPEKMEYVVRQVGSVRMLIATALAGLTRPLGIHGVFYLVAGQKARAMDGMRPPFEDLLLPPLPPRQAHSIALQLARRLAAPVAIVDMNDRGGSIRAVSHPVISKRRLRRILADNPLGQRDTRTPIGLVRSDGLSA
jgi:F420-0:gamma-glutamyl ligase